MSNRTPITKDVIIVTCGDWDFKICYPSNYILHYNDLSPTAKAYQPTTWCNIKLLFEDVMKNTIIKKAGSMTKMLYVLKLPFIGRHHRGIDDTRNVVQILIELIKRGGIVTTQTALPEATWSRKLRRAGLIKYTPALDVQSSSKISHQQ